MICIWHLCEVMLTGAKTKFCSVQCKNKYWVTEHRKKVKLKLVELAGGKCERCGWNEHPAGFNFHHRDPSKKEFALADKGLTRNFSKNLEEMAKCHLLCANCHNVIHATKDPVWLEIKMS